MDPKKLAHAILDLCTEDWYGLWEIRDHVIDALQTSRDPVFMIVLRDQLAEMMEHGLLEAALWSHGPPQPLSGEYVRNLSVDSILWESPGITDIEEQIRVTSTEAGDRAYFGSSSA